MRLLDALAAGEPGIIDLSQPLRDGMPCSPTHPGFHLALARRHGDSVRPDGMTGSHELITMGGHVGTHMDALCHVAVDGRMHGGVPVAIEQGRYTRHGIDEVPPMVCRGVLADVPALRGTDRLAPGEPVTAADLDSALDTAFGGVGVRRGDVVLIRTGWPQLWDDPAAYLGTGSGVPGLDAGGARRLAEAGVRAVGGDTLALEHIPAGAGLGRLPVHRILLQDAGINLIEVMNLEALAATGAREFVFVCAPLRIVGATGAPVRPLALVGP
ncbi:cyclase family protein [Amycolatopsis rhizosphaerae]|uniref:Cyclase family protein n=1 Tax=Amycolatopsis rhizosphaerae TaxID=2053003 RepID=A0A558CS61_9PSEU|nr:cyclase family protein [Amycolatopsis rhizosphaerae]TVT51593.1 cyclase family protein [Amycolatopsis rhizosphaerae]